MFPEIAKIISTALNNSIYKKEKKEVEDKHVQKF